MNITNRNIKAYVQCSAWRLDRSVVETGKVLLKDISSKVAVIDLCVCVAEGEGEYCKYFVYPLAQKTRLQLD